MDAFGTADSNAAESAAKSDFLKKFASSRVETVYTMGTAPRGFARILDQRVNRECWEFPGQTCLGAAQWCLDVN